MAPVRLEIHNTDRSRLYSVEVDEKNPPSVVKPPVGDGPQVSLNWDQAFDDERHLRRCPVCGCRELFARKDFPQVTGLVIVVLAAVISMVLFYHRMTSLALGVLAAVVVVDLLIFFFTGRALVCYRCRSEFRDTAIRSDHPGWELAVGEKYRFQPPPPVAAPTPQTTAAVDSQQKSAPPD